MEDSVMVRKNAFFAMDLIPQLPKSAHVIHLNKKFSNSSVETILTIGEARRLYTQSSKTHYSDAAKINTTALNIEEIVNQRVESIVQNITIKMEEQTTLLIEIFQKQLKVLCNIWSQYSTKLTSKNPPNRKRQMINLVPPTNNLMQWDAGGSNASN
ncbi:hypothetical protein CEXT_355171 [Caerostris extrusa]|uniref:Uncharacterized protein n=1 Tax=Caerostris extrusa TaxID=172846 RepID=A0AAV4MIU9_CAEEX|nr:hypothetical protein CEXT_355171 [Caerostris extrusa]